MLRLRSRLQSVKDHSYEKALAPRHDQTPQSGPTVISNLVKHSSVSILDGGDHSDVAGFTLSDLVKLAARQDTKAA